jgi:TP901 family phage tail tape measure protein
MGLDTRKLDMGVAKASASLKGLEGKQAALSNSMKMAAGGIALVGGAVAVAAVKLATDFESAMHRAWSVTDDTKEAMQGWSDEVLKMSKTLPTSAKDLAEALYWIKSDMPDATDAEQFKTLDIAAKGAIGGVAELSDATEALITVQNAYNDMRPDHYMDLMNWAVQRGSITLQDFVGNMGKVTGTAAAMDVPFNEIAAAIATLTRKGIPAETAFMAVNNLMLKMINPTDDAAEAAAELGLTFDYNTLKAKGLGGMLADIAERVGDDKGKIVELIPELRGLKAAFPLAGTAAAEFADDLARSGNVAGTSAGMYGKMMDDPAKKFELALNKMKTRLTEVGIDMMPALERALKKVTDILDGKNEVFNAFGDILKGVASATWDVIGALKSIWPLLLGVGAAFVAFKLTNFVSSIVSATSSLPLLNNVVANLKLGFTSSTASVGGLATSLGTIGLIAAPIAIGMGYLIKGIQDTDHAAEAAWKSMKDYDEVAAQNGMTLATLFTKYRDLRAALADTSKSEAEHAAIAQELGQTKAELVDKFPEVVAGFDSERNAILRTDDAIQKHIDNLLKYQNMQGGARPDKSNLENFEAISQTLDKIDGKRGSVEGTITNVVEELGKLGDTTGIQANLDQLWHDMATSPKGAKAAIEDYLNVLQGSGQLPGMGLAEKFGVAPAAFNDVRAALDKYSLAVTNAGGSLEQLDDKSVEAQATLRSLASSMVSAAQEAGVAGQQMPDFILQGFLSARPQLQQAGVQSLAAFVEGASKGAVPADAAGQIAQQMFNSGTFTATGVESVDKALSAMAAQFKANRFGEAIGESIGKWFGGGKEETKKVALKVTDGGSGAATAKSLDQVSGKADQLNKKRPTVKAHGDTAQPNSAITRLLNRCANIDGQTLATVNIKAQIIGSGPFTADEYVRYLENKIGGAKPQLTVSAGMGPIAGGGLTSALDKAMARLNSTSLVGWSKDMDLAAGRFGKMEEAILALGGDLDAWRNVRKEYDDAKTALAGYAKQIEESDVRLNKLQHSQELLNRSLSEHKERLSTLQQMKMKGEGAASDKSFSQQHELNRLQLEILKAQKEGRFNDAARLAGDKAKLEKEKEILDLQTQYTYEDEKRALEKLMDPLKGKEMTYKEIVKQVKAEQKVIATQEAALRKVERAINREKDAVWLLKNQFDAATKVVQGYQSQIDAMAANFLKHYDEMIAKQEELNRLMAEGTPGETGGSMGVSGLGASNVRGAGGSFSTTTTTVDSLTIQNAYFYGVQNPSDLKKQLKDYKLRTMV